PREASSTAPTSGAPPSVFAQRPTFRIHTLLSSKLRILIAPDRLGPIATKHADISSFYSQGHHQDETLAAFASLSLHGHRLCFVLRPAIRILQALCLAPGRRWHLRCRSLGPFGARAKRVPASRI